MGKPKFVEIVRDYGSGCGVQISKKQNYQLNPLITMRDKGYNCEIWVLDKLAKNKTTSFEGFKVRRFSNTFSLIFHLFIDKDIKLVYGQLRPFLPTLISPLSFKKCIMVTQTYEFGNWFTKQFSLFFMKMFTRIFALTPYELEEYIKNGLNKKKVVCMPHAIDYSFFSEELKNLDRIRKKYGIKKGEFIITTVANFRKFKNLDVMIAAFALFNKKVHNSKMIIVGIDQTKNPLYAERRKYEEVEDASTVIKRENLSDKVIFLGSKGYKDVRDIHNISDVFVNSSDPEGMGMAVYEAASVGVPLCLSSIGSFTSVFKDMALYNKPRDKQKLADNYLKYYNDKVLRLKMKGELKEYIKDWDYSVVMKRFDKLFLEVLG